MVMLLSRMLVKVRMEEVMNDGSDSDDSDDHNNDCKGEA